MSKRTYTKEQRAKRIERVAKWRKENPELLKKSRMRYDANLKKRKPIYGVWGHIKSRCYNKNDKRYYLYGERGITVCKKWRDSYEAFAKDMGPRPSPIHQIDRINVNGNYEPSNCRWVLPAENARNKRNTRLSIEIAREIRAATGSYSQIAKRFGLQKGTVSSIKANIIWFEI